MKNTQINIRHLEEILFIHLLFFYLLRLGHNLNYFVHSNDFVVFNQIKRIACQSVINLDAKSICVFILNNLYLPLLCLTYGLESFNRLPVKKKAVILFLKLTFKIYFFKQICKGYNI